MLLSGSELFVPHSRLAAAADDQVMGAAGHRVDTSSGRIQLADCRQPTSCA